MTRQPLKEMIANRKQELKESQLGDESKPMDEVSMGLAGRTYAARLKQHDTIRKANLYPHLKLLDKKSSGPEAEARAKAKLDKSAERYRAATSKEHAKIMAKQSSKSPEELRRDANDAHAYNRARGLSNEEFNLDNYSLEEIQDFMMSEDFDSLDELSKATLGSYVKKAKPEIAAHGQDADYSRQIGDKKNANDSRRKEFNREKGVNVARAKLGRKHDSSYYAGNIKVKANEEIDEEHKVHVDTGAKYNKELHPKDVEHVRAGIDKHGATFAGNTDKGIVFKFKTAQHATNFKNHTNKSPHRSMTADLHEEVVNELSNDTLGNYIKKSFRQGNDIHYDLAHLHGNKATDAERSAMKAKLAKRNMGIIKASQKMKEDNMLVFKQFKNIITEKTLTPAEMKKRDEIAKAMEKTNPDMPMGMKMAIATKSAKRVAEAMQVKPNNNMMTDSPKGSMSLKAAEKKERSKHNQSLAKNAFDNMFGDNKGGLNKLKIREQDESASTVSELSTELLSRYKKAAVPSASDAYDRGNPAMGKRRIAGLIRATKKQMKNDTMMEENDGMDEEGKMAKGQLMRMASQANALFAMMDDFTQLDSWIQSKITMASDYLDTAHDYLMHNKQDVDEGVHMCAKHVRSEILGDGVVLEAQHADPDEEGKIEWYMVEFQTGVHKVFTEDLFIMHEMMHGNHKKKKRMTNGR